MIARLIVIAVLVGAVYFGWRWMFPDDEAQIRGVLVSIADGLETEGGDASSVQGLARVAALQNEFAPDAIIVAGPPFQRLTGRQAIVAAAARVRVAVRNLEIDFPEIAISVAGDRQTATALVTAEAHFADAAASRGLNARDFEVAFARLDGRWVVTSATLIEPLERLDR